MIEIDDTYEGKKEGNEDRKRGGEEEEDSLEKGFLDARLENKRGTTDGWPEAPSRCKLFESCTISEAVFCGADPRGV